MPASKTTEPRCQIVRTLDVLGEKWSLLIVRNALRGETRFSEFRDSLGVPSDILTARLATLVAAGILEKKPYRDPGDRERTGYHLTDAGQALRLVLASIIQWGDEYNPSSFGPSSVVVDRGTHSHLGLAFVDETGEQHPFDTVAIVPGPGATSTW